MYISDEIRDEIKNKYGIDINRYTDKIAVNAADLDTEVSELSQFVFEVNNLAAFTFADKKAADLETKRTYARLYRLVREQSSAQTKRVTEAAIDAEIVTNSDYINSQQTEIRLTRIHDTVVALREAFKQKGYLLKELVQMVLQGFTTPDSM